MRGLIVLLTLVSAAACGSDDASTDSAIPPGDSAIDFDASGLNITPPASAVLPTITPCPDGWNEVAGEVTTCEPWAFDAPPACAAHEARFVGDPACARVGTACAADGWPSDLPAGGTIRYVREGGAGTGTQGDPFGTITDALVGISAGTIVAVAVGTYDEILDVPAGVTIQGACVERTIVTSDRGAIDHGVFTVVGAGVEIRNLHIGPSQQGGILVVGAGRSATVRDVVIEDVRAVGIDVERGGQIDGENVVVRRVISSVTGLFGRGVTTENGATAAYRRLVVEEATEFGVLSIGDDTTVDLEDVWIARTEALPDGTAGPGIVGWGNGSITGRRLVVDENTDLGIGGNLATLDLEMVLVRGTRMRPEEQDHGRGFDVEAGTISSCQRCVMDDNSEFGILVDGEGTAATFDHLVVRRTKQVLDGLFGRAITVQNGADIRAAHSLLTDNGEIGVMIGGPQPGRGSLTDVTVRRTQPSTSSGRFGRALTVQNGSSLSVERALFEDLFEAAVLAGDPGSTVTLSDVVIRNVAVVDTELPTGRGMVAQQGAAIEMHRAVIEDVNDIGIVAYHDAASVVVSDLVMERVVELSCETGTFCTMAGHGLAAYFDSTLTAERFRIADADVCGVHVAEGGRATLMTGLVTRSAIGACVQSDAQRIEDLQRDVRYLGNASSLDATSLPVPDALPRVADPP